MAADYETATWAFYRYEPSLPAAVIFVILFLITAVLHLFQMVKTKTWFFIPFVVGGFMELIGYVGRAVSSQEAPDWTLGPYIVQTLLLLVAPALFAATIYMTLGRIILLVDGEAHSIIPKRWLTKLFVAGDVISFMLQGAGGGIMAGGNIDSVHNGEKIIIGGLFVQLLFFGLFIITAGIFHLRLIKMPTPASVLHDIPWRKHPYVLYIVSMLVMVRSVFRVVEYIQGNDGYLLRHEVYLYIFDSVLMLLAMLLFNWVHPSEVQALLHGGTYSTKFIKLDNLRSAL